MRQALSVWFLVIALLGCLAIPDGILNDGDDPSDFDVSGDPPAVAASRHLSATLSRPVDYDRPVLLHPLPRLSTQWPDLRILLARLGPRGNSRRVPGRTTNPPRMASATRTSLSLCDSATDV